MLRNLFRREFKNKAIDYLGKRIGTWRNVEEKMSTFMPFDANILFFGFILDVKENPRRNLNRSFLSFNVTIFSLLIV